MIRLLLVIRRARPSHCAAFIALVDITLALGVLPLQRYAVNAALSASTPAWILAGLLLVNLLLLGALVCAALASCGLFVRCGAFALRAVRRSTLNR